MRSRGARRVRRFTSHVSARGASAGTSVAKRGGMPRVHLESSRRSHMQTACNCVQDTRGATLVEIIVLVGVVALLAMAGFRIFGRSLMGTSDALGVHVTNLTATNGGLASNDPGSFCTS